MITIVIGDVANSVPEHAQLLTESNKQLATGMYYASLADFSSYRSFVDTLDQADHIVYAPPHSWSDQNKQGISYMKIWTEHCLFYFNDKKLVTGASFATPVDDQQILKLSDTRKSNDQQLWIVGGSNSYGLGVASNERFGQLIADSLKLPVSFLTEIGSSMEWASDQILRSDIRSGDIIIWATVPVSRFPFYCNESVVHVNVDHYEKNPKFNNQVDIDQLGNSNTLLYRPLTSVERVQNMCNKLNIKLVIAGISKHSEYTSHLLKFKNYIHLAGRFGLNVNDEYLDVGDDNFHQGPKMHRWYADQIITKLVANN
jgi:hypothetical protein